LPRRVIELRRCGPWAFAAYYACRIEEVLSSFFDAPAAATLTFDRAGKSGNFLRLKRLRHPFFTGIRERQAA
jgi:hypothetical protein